jgi:hypothetical protein
VISARGKKWVALTHAKVAGRKTNVIAAIVFIEELSRSVASAILAESRERP